MSSFPESIFTDSLNNLGRVYIYVFSEIALSLSVLEILLQSLLFCLYRESSPFKIERQIINLLSELIYLQICSDAFYLREDMYQEYDNFYTIFDETFLGIYPDFVQKVNALLREDARFPVPTTRVLRTELRVLAAIRLGITESGKIASFLKCAPPTVYTYRAKLRNSAICDKEEFEDLVREIQ